MNHNNEIEKQNSIYFSRGLHVVLFPFSTKVPLKTSIIDHMLLYSALSSAYVSTQKM